MCPKYSLPIYSSVDELPDTAKYIFSSNENFIGRVENECAVSSQNLQVLNLHEKLKEYDIYAKNVQQYVNHLQRIMRLTFNLMRYNINLF